MRLRSPAVALLLVVLVAACHRSPRVRGIAYTPATNITELTPPPCSPVARPGSLEHRMATTPTAVPPATAQLVVRVLSADSDTAIAGAMVGVDAFRAKSSPVPGVFVRDSVAAGQHRVVVNAFGYVQLRDSLPARAGYADTLVARLALWCK